MQAIVETAIQDLGDAMRIVLEFAAAATSGFLRRNDANMVMRKGPSV
jgi:hypothetical protein